MSDTVILSGLEASSALYDSLHARIDALKSKQIIPGLAAILVGENTFGKGALERFDQEAKKNMEKMNFYSTNLYKSFKKKIIKI